MFATQAAVAKAALPTSGDTGQVEIAGDTGVGAEIRHHRQPLTTVGLDPVQAVQTVHDIVRHLVRHRAAQVVLKVLGEQPGVVADAGVLSSHPEHAGTAALQIEVYRHRREVSAVEISRKPDIAQGFRSHQVLLWLVDGLDHGQHDSEAPGGFTSA